MLRTLPFTMTSACFVAPVGNSTAHSPMEPSPRIPAVLAACSALLAGAAVVPIGMPAFAESSRTSDVSITAGVRRELIGMTKSSTLAVDVQTVDGVVRLRGELPDDIDVQHAIDGARRVAGVRDVDASQLAARPDRRH